MFLDNLKNRWLSNKSELMAILLPAILIISTIFLFGPTTIYSGNISEFDASLLNMLYFYLIPSIIAVIVLLGIGILLPKRFFSLFVSLLVGMGLLLWIQGNFLLWKHGPLGIVDIDWTKEAWRAWIDGALWISFICLAIIFSKRLKKITVLVSLALISVQLLYLVFNTIENPEMWKENERFAQPITPPQEIFQFSSKQNVIHIILDEFQSTVFEEIVSEDPEHYSNALQGLTFFRDTTGSFPTTVMSIPAILSEQIYRNDVPIHFFKDNVYNGKTIPTVLHENGYEVDFAVPFDWYCKGPFTNCYQIPVPYGITKKQHIEGNAALLLNLVFLRYAPQFFKGYIYNNQIGLPAIKLKGGGVQHWSGARNLAHKDFLQDFIENMSVTRKAPVYKFIHVTTTHWPAVLNRDCEYAGKILPWTWENLKVQAKCSFDHFLAFLNELKSLGIYDSSLIILHADHGYWLIPDSADQINLKNVNWPLNGYFTDDKEYFAKIVCSAMPLLAIKPPYSKGPLRISNVQSMLTDIPATINSVLNLGENFKGESLFEIDENHQRVRSFRYYDRLNRAEDDYFERMDEFIIKGSVFDKASWQFSGHLSPRASHQETKIDFGTDEAIRFLRSGWDNNKGVSEDALTFQWAMGESASIFLSLSRDKDVLLTANVKTFLKSQNITVRVDGRQVGAWDISPSWQWEKHSVVITRDKRSPNLSVIEFVFSEHMKPGGEDPRPLAVLFESVTLKEFTES